MVGFSESCPVVLVLWSPLSTSEYQRHHGVFAMIGFFFVDVIIVESWEVSAQWLIRLGLTRQCLR